MKFYSKSSKIPSLGLVLFLTCLRFARSEDESSEEKGVPIIRQINKVNDDGTYTYGYEAADGSFKIETRDVLGNVKGMFGFIDESGDLKRVSYTANNETGFRNSIVHAPTSTPYSTARPQSLEALGRRPVLLLKNTAGGHPPTKGPVIQHIPKKLQKEDDENTSTTVSGSEYGGANGRRFPNALNGTKNTSEEHTEEPKSHGVNPLRKVLVSKRPVEDKEIKGKGGNNLRRQLNRGLDLRGETTHIYTGGDGRYSSNLPPHLSALMSELRPIQVVRTAGAESIGYQTVDVEAVPQEINEVAATTTEIPYGTRKYVQPSAPPGYISPRYRPRPVPVPEEAQYLQEVPPHYKGPGPIPPQGLPQVPQHLPLALNVPFGAQGSPNYQMQPNYYDQAPYMIPPTLRDELMAIIYNYLQVRLGALGQNPYYQSGYPRPPYGNPYINSPLINPYANPYPYVNPYLNVPPYYPYPNPSVYPVPSQTPYAGPNVQFSSHQEAPRRVSQNRLPTRAATDDADLLQMLLTSPTRMPISQLRYSPTTERIVTSKATQPIRNIQIITDTTESRPVTTETPER